MRLKSVCGKLELLSGRASELFNDPLHFQEYYDHGSCYLLREWFDKYPTDLSPGYSRDVSYYKFSKTTFRRYESEEGENWSHDIKEVMNWTRVDPYDKYQDCLLLKSLITEEGLRELKALSPRYIRLLDERGDTSWYRLTE
jgi:hypothetical protein